MRDVPCGPLARPVGMLDDVRAVRAHVMVVDDEPQVRATVREALEYEGYEVSEAGTGAEALALLAAKPADAVVFDLWMPVMDGWELRRRVLAAYPALPVVEVS